MKADLERAKSIFTGSDYTCVLCKDDTVYTSTERGLKPLIAWINNGTDLKGFCAADRIVGKAAALLYVLLGVDTVYAPVMSEAGIYTLAKNGITPLYDTSVKEIRNRMDTGLCPMEEAVQDITDPNKGLYALKGKIRQMMTSHS